MQPSRRPKDGRYGENPNRLQHYYQFQVILKPNPPDIQDLYLQSLYEIAVVTKVAPGSFFPRPNVASIVLSFKPLANPLVPSGQRPEFVRLVKNLFQQRRKTIHSTLRSFYELSDESLARISTQTGIDLKSRPEALSKEAFLLLSRAVAGERS